MAKNKKPTTLIRVFKDDAEKIFMAARKAGITVAMMVQKLVRAK